MKYDHPLQILSNRRLEETIKELILATVIHLFLFQFSSQQEARGEQEGRIQAPGGEQVTGRSGLRVIRLISSSVFTLL